MLKYYNDEVSKIIMKKVFQTEKEYNDYENTFNHISINNIDYKIIHNIEEMKLIKTENERIVYHCENPNCKYHENNWFIMNLAKKSRIPNYIKFGKLLCKECRFNLNYDSKKANIRREETNMSRYGEQHYINKEKRSNTLRNKYGDNITSTLQLKDIRDKRNKTMLDKYGTIHALQNKDCMDRYMEKWNNKSDEEKREILNKRIDTNREKYNKDWYVDTEEFKYIKEKGSLEKFGVSNPFNSEKCQENIREKSIQTCLKKYHKPYFVESDEFSKIIFEKYNAKYYMSSEDFKEKTKQTCLNKYHNKTYFGSEDCENKTENTCLYKYMNPTYFGSKEYYDEMERKYGCRKPPSFKYNYYGIFFDSSWELAVWIYCIDNNIPIVRNPFIYQYEYNGKIHQYNPDFWIYGLGVVEIKGDYLKNDDGKWYLPFNKLHHNSKPLTSNEKEYYDGLYEAKHQCALQNNVKIMYKDECIVYLNYIQQSYSQKYLSMFTKHVCDNTYTFSIPYNKSKPLDYIKSEDNYSFVSDKGINPYDIGLIKDKGTVIRRYSK